MRRAAYLKNIRMVRLRNLRRRRAAYNRRMKALRAKHAALRHQLRSKKVVKAAPAPACSTCATAAPNVTMEQKTIVAAHM
jgi:hypothetical protein